VWIEHSSIKQLTKIEFSFFLSHPSDDFGLLYLGNLERYIMKLKLTYIRLPKGTKGCIEQSHYDLHTVEKESLNIACILTNKNGAKLIRSWIEKHNAIYRHK